MVVNLITLFKCSRKTMQCSRKNRKGIQQQRTQKEDKLFAKSRHVFVI
jgi:hypothetical protein